MAEYTAFDILGPVMIGPSSSHTAGACRIANIARKICGADFESVEFFLHGSFAYTYKGHGTDCALIGGMLGYDTDDSRIRTAFEDAEKQNMKYKIHKIDLGEEYHPNTVKILFHFSDREDEYVIGSSVGGGAMVIVNINGIKVEYRGGYPTILLQYNEQKGVIASVSTILLDNNYNIETIMTHKNTLTNVVTLTIEVDSKITDTVKEQIGNTNRFLTQKYVEV